MEDAKKALKHKASRYVDHIFCLECWRHVPMQTGVVRDREKEVCSLNERGFRPIMCMSTDRGSSTTPTSPCSGVNALGAAGKRRRPPPPLLLRLSAQ